MGDEPARLSSNLCAIRFFGIERSLRPNSPARERPGGWQMGRLRVRSRVAPRQCLEKPTAICYLIAYRVIIIKYHSSSFGR